MSVFDDFTNLVADFHATSDLFGAVTRAEQAGADLPPIVVGVHAWQMLDELQQHNSMRELLTAYVRMTRIDRATDIEEAAQALLDNLGPLTGDEQ